MMSIQETYDSLLKAEELLKYAIKHHGKALSALCEIDDHTVNIRNEYHVPSTYNNVGRTENIIEALNSAAEKYSEMIYELEGDWPDLLDDPDAYDESHED
jgi:flagellar biosynthesis/type III secretory pathway chaperone